MELDSPQNNERDDLRGRIVCFTGGRLNSPPLPQRHLSSHEDDTATLIGCGEGRLWKELRGAQFLREIGSVSQEL